MTARIKTTEKIQIRPWIPRAPQTLAERNGFYAQIRKYCLAPAFSYFLIFSAFSGEPGREVPLSNETAYNPIPSPDGKMIAYVRTGWRREGFTGLGRGSLLSEVMVMSADGTPLSTMPLADAFLAGWTPDSHALICYRDETYSVITLDGTSILRGTVPNVFPRTERVFYLSGLRAVGWSLSKGASDTLHTVIEMYGRVLGEHPKWLGEVVVPSPDERYLAIFNDQGRKDLWIYDIQSQRWSDLGPFTVHPDDSWGWMKASWNPWFSDSSRLVYLSGSNLIISKPDGSGRETIPIPGAAGLPTPSPDGKSVAYLTFDPRPVKLRPDLKFWGGSIVWVLPLAHGAKPVAVTQKSPATSYDLRWLDNRAIVFDRFEDEAFPTHARIWKVAVRSGAEEVTPVNLSSKR